MIPVEAVEAAAKALGVGPYGITRTQLEIALEAAAPYIRAQALEEAATELDDKRLLSKAFHIFYPEWLRERASRMVTK